MALKDLFSWSGRGEEKTSSACGAGDPKPTACGSACGAGGRQ